MEVSEKHMGLRVAAFAVCLAVGLGSLGYWLYSLLSTEPGWVEIESSSGEIHCGADFNFRYLTGQGGASPSAEVRQLRKLYTELTRTAYQIFTPAEGFDDIHNLWYINSHPNEDIEVDPALYRAIEQVESWEGRQNLQRYQGRWLYRGLLYNVYDDLFFCQNDEEAQVLDPFENPEQEEFCRELEAFANDPGHVDLKLLGDNTLRLEVSEEYQQYAQDVGRTQYLDFGWLRNAFIADYFADELNQAGFANGTISSYDGYIRVLGSGVGGQVFSLYDWAQDHAVILCQTELERPVNMANLRAFPLSERDENRMYVYESGVVRHPYLKLNESPDTNALGSMALYSESMNCGNLALRAGEMFLTGQYDELTEMRQESVEMIASRMWNVQYTQPDLTFENVYEGEYGRPEFLLLEE